MGTENANLRRIKERWTKEKKITGKDVEWLLAQAAHAETMRAANSLRTGPGRGLLDDLFGGR